MRKRLSSPQPTHRTNSIHPPPLISLLLFIYKIAFVQILLSPSGSGASADFLKKTSIKMKAFLSTILQKKKTEMKAFLKETASSGTLLDLLETIYSQSLESGL